MIRSSDYNTRDMGLDYSTKDFRTRDMGPDYSTVQCTNYKGPDCNTSV